MYVILVWLDGNVKSVVGPFEDRDAADTWECENFDWDDRATFDIRPLTA